MNDNVELTEEMKDEARVKRLNEDSVIHLQDWLERIDEGEASEDDLLASLYGSMVAASVLGYDIQTMADDAKKGADKLVEVLAEEVSNEE